MATATVRQDGTVLLPEAVRREAGLEPGDEIEIMAQGQGRIVAIAKDVRGAKGHSLTRLFGILGVPERRLTIEEMNEVIRRRGAGL